jgi:hypothetical protein
VLPTFSSGSLKGRELGRPRCKLECTLKMDLEELGCDIVDIIFLAQDKV